MSSWAIRSLPGAADEMLADNDWRTLCEENDAHASQIPPGRHRTIPGAHSVDDSAYKKYFTDAPNVYKKASAVELVIKAYSSASGDVLKTATETISDIFSKSEVSKHDLKVERQIDLVADLLKVMNKRSEKFMEIKDIRSKLLQVLKNEEIKSVKGFGKISTQVDMFVAKIDPSFAKKSKEDKNAQKKQQKEALLQSKIARDEARKAKFEAIKKEKMEKGEWVEKNEWKANEKRSRGVSESEKPQKKKKKFYKPNA